MDRSFVIMRRHRFHLVLLAGLACAPVTASPVHGQVAPALAGVGAGFLGGGVATMSLIVARARWESEYIEGVHDFIGLNGTPVLVGTATGLAIGLWDGERLKRAVIGGTGGMALGFGSGWIAGSLLGDRRADKWAGGVIGAGIGLAAGALVGAFLPLDEDGQAGEVAALHTGEPPRNSDGLRLFIRLPIR